MKTFDQAWQEFEARKRVTVTFETFKAGFEAGQSCKSPDPQAAESRGGAGGEQSSSVPVKWIDFNINYYVRVKLTPEGVDSLQKWHAELFGRLVEANPFRLDVDSEGWTKFQLWDLMWQLGDACYLGSKPMFTDLQFRIEG